MCYIASSLLFPEYTLQALIRIYFLAEDSGMPPLIIATPLFVGVRGVI